MLQGWYGALQEWDGVLHGWDGVLQGWYYMASCMDGVHWGGVAKMEFGVLNE